MIYTVKSNDYFIEGGDEEVEALILSDLEDFFLKNGLVKDE